VIKRTDGSVELSDGGTPGPAQRGGVEGWKRVKKLREGENGSVLKWGREGMEKEGIGWERICTSQTDLWDQPMRQWTN